MSASRLAQFFAAAPSRRLAPGEAIFRRDDAVERVFWLEAGAVRLVRDGANGGRVVLHRASGPCWLAEASLFAERYHCDGEAVSEARVRVRRREEMLAALAASPELAVDALALVSGNLREARARAELLTLRTVAERLDAWLDGAGDKPSTTPWAAVAAEIGVSAEALYRELAKRRRGAP